MTLKYTVLDDNRRFKQTHWGLFPLPHCQADFFDMTITCHKPGEFDTPTVNGPWADLCREHALQFAAPGMMGFHRMQP